MNEENNIDITPQLGIQLVEAKMVEEMHSYLREHGEWAAKRNVLKYWKSCYEAGGKGEAPPKVDESGIPFLLLKRWALAPAVAHRTFERARFSLPPEKLEEIQRKKAEQKEMDDSIAKAAGKFVPVTEADRQIVGVLPDAELIAMSSERRVALAQKVMDLQLKNRLQGN